MFAPRVFAFLFVGIAVCSALPANTSEKSGIPRPVTTISEDDIEDAPWFSFPLFGNLFAPLWKLFPSFADIGPRIVADDDKFQVVVNVNDYKTDDLKVKVKNDFIFVQGSHEGKPNESNVFASQFFHTYSLPVNSSSADVTADLSSDGYLTVTAPLKGDSIRGKDVDREVPINETGVPYQPPKEEKPIESTASPAPVTEADNDRKEPTTPPQIDESIDKDNNIPHGNDLTV